MGIINVAPAYGRDYKSKEAVKEGWDAGHDFYITDNFNGGGTYINNKDHAVYAPEHSILVNYKRGTSWHTIPALKRR